MKQATITLTDDLEQALERYQQDFGVPPELDAVVQQALRMYLNQHGYLAVGSSDPLAAELLFIPSIGGKPKPLANAPVLDDEHSVARAVIEDRR